MTPQTTRTETPGADTTVLTESREHEAARLASAVPSIDTIPAEPRSLSEEFLARMDLIREDAIAVGRVLPGAVSRSAHGGGLGEALVPAVQRAMLLSGKRDPRSLAEALAPSIGPALRRSVWQSIRGVVKAINFWMLQHASLKGMQWRLEAHRTGRSFEEVVTEHTEASPVRQVFLIHRETGLVLNEAQSLATGTPQDWDIISGMLTALQDFVHDSFSLNQDTALETIKVGDVTVLIEQGPHAALAAILDGSIRSEYVQRIKEVCSRIHAEFSMPLSDFDGDTSAFSECTPHLELCLHNLINPNRLPLLPQTVVALLLPVFLLAAWILPGVVDSVRWDGYIRQLANEPGIIVINEGREDGVYYVTGLRDPLATDPQDLLVRAGFTPGDIVSRWEPFQGLSSNLKLVRARRLLNPPDTVLLHMRNEMLTLEGTAPRDWIVRAQEQLERWAELDNKFDMTALHPSDAGSEKLWRDYLTRLKKEPGLMVIQTGLNPDGGYTLVGLADPLARNPADLLAESGLPEKDLKQQWEAFQSSDHRIAAQRARYLLEPPQTVNLSVHDGVLRLEGEAPSRWIREVQSLAKSIPGIRSVHRDLLADTDARDVRNAVTSIEATVFRLLVGSPDLWPGQEKRLAQLLKDISQLRRSSRREDVDFMIEIRGHTAPTGSTQRDTAMSESLTRSFLEILRRESQDTRLFTRRSQGSTAPDVEGKWLRKADERLISFKVVQLD